jgi:hypothetical protein
MTDERKEQEVEETKATAELETRLGSDQAVRRGVPEVKEEAIDGSAAADGVAGSTGPGGASSTSGSPAPTTTSTGTSTSTGPTPAGGSTT